jgi:hypothetical protein
MPRSSNSVLQIRPYCSRLINIVRKKVRLIHLTDNSISFLIYKHYTLIDHTQFSLINLQYPVHEA